MWEDDDDYVYDTMVDERLCDNLCIRCATPMPTKDSGWVYTTSIGKPAKCPKCAKYQWEKINE